MHWH